nr:Chain P, hinge peptide from ADP-ribosylation factor binding protein GGA1 [synthetic construct]2DWX_Q Chain Q, hinge peptide from ADP-ribosylation factor binding protein GGA1 [synthetic construct]
SLDGTGWNSFQSS